MKFKPFQRLAATLVLSLLAGCGGAAHDVIPSTANAVDSTIADRPAGRDLVAGVPQLGGSGLHDLGRAPADVRLPIAVTLRYRNEAQLERFISSQESLPKGVRPHWLTNAQFDARYAPSAGDYARVVRSLQAAGLRVIGRFENRTVIDAEGSADTLDAYFGTQIHRVKQSGYGVRYSNVRPAFAPASLRGLLLSVDGLSTLSLVHVFTPPAPPTGSEDARAPDATRELSPKLFGPPNTSRMNSVGYGPGAFDRAYNFPIMHSTGNAVYDGRGRGIAFIMDSDFLDSDVATFVKYFGITRPDSNTKRVPIDGGAPPGDEAVNSVFSTFMLESMAGLAPGARVYAYEIHPGFALNNVTDAFNQIVSDNRVDVVPSAFGNCEAVIPKTAEAWGAIAEQALAKGIVFAAGSGDLGGTLCTQIPASSPYFTAVGGTAVEIGPHGVWFNEPADLFSSGGVSKVFAMPSWQNGVPGTASSGRNVPDIAFDSFDTVGGAGYMAINSGWNSDINPYSGTGLLASSIYAAAIAQIDQVKNERTGLANEKLFDLWKVVGYGTNEHPYFHDALEGGSGLYFAVPGYDFVTGIGSVDLWNLTQQL